MYNSIFVERNYHLGPFATNDGITWFKVSKLLQKFVSAV
jgi:hypothetical protein